MASEHRTKCDALRKCSIASVGRDATGTGHSATRVDKPTINYSSALGSDECAGNIVAGFFEPQFIKS